MGLQEERGMLSERLKWNVFDLFDVARNQLGLDVAFCFVLHYSQPAALCPGFGSSGLILSLNRVELPCTVLSNECRKMPSESQVLVARGQLVLPDKTLSNGMLIAQSGRIEYLGEPCENVPQDAQVVDAAGGWIAPGFVDIHVHGGAGADFMDGTLDAFRTAGACHLKHGTTTFFPTTTTGTPAQIDAMLSAAQQASSHWQAGQGALVAGVHLYGPYFAADKVGCHRLEGRRDPTREEFERYFATNLVRIATCAAELPGAGEFYSAARRAGCLITCGHSNATWHEMQAAFNGGMRHVDHFWCAMSSVASLRGRCGTPMQASMEQFVLANDEMSTEVIADGCHLSDELLNFAYRMKNSHRLCLVTDASRALDMPTGRYRFGNADDGEWFDHDGLVGRTMDRSGLASSTAGMDRMIRTMLSATGAPLHEIIRMASLTPAQLAGVDVDCGSLQVGKRADIVILDESITVRQVFQSGQLCYRSA
jgi:N-acetylglucosamine-6-phosphate deacetylase